MNEQLYTVLDWAGNVEGSHLNITNALILIKGLYEKYYLEPTLKFQIQREAGVKPYEFETSVYGDNTSCETCRYTHEEENGVHCRECSHNYLNKWMPGEEE